MAIINGARVEEEDGGGDENNGRDGRTPTTRLGLAHGSRVRAKWWATSGYLFLFRMRWTDLRGWSKSTS